MADESIPDMKRRYMAQVHEYRDLERRMRADNPDCTSFDVATAHRQLRESQGRPLMTNRELTILYDALPDDPRERQPRVFESVEWAGAQALRADVDRQIHEARTDPPPPQGVLARLVDWAGRRLFGGSWR